VLRSISQLIEADETAVGQPTQEPAIALLADTGWMQSA